MNRNSKEIKTRTRPHRRTNEWEVPRRPRAAPARNKRTGHCMTRLGHPSNIRLDQCLTHNLLQDFNTTSTKKEREEKCVIREQAKMPRQKATIFEEKEEYAPGEPSPRRQATDWAHSHRLHADRQRIGRIATVCTPTGNGLGA